MLIGIDHVIVAVADPDLAARELEELIGLSATGGGRHEAHGTYNRLIWLGDSYVELMGVFDEGLAAKSWWGAHMVSILSTSTDSYAGVVFVTDDLITDVDRLRAQGSTVGDPMAGERRRPDGDVVRWRTARLPAPDSELGLMFLIEHDPTGAEWRADDRAARAAQQAPGLGLVRLARGELPVADVARASMRLLKDFGIQFRPSLAGGGARDASLGAQTLRLIPSGGPPARPRITVMASGLGSERRASVLGCDWLLNRG